MSDLAGLQQWRSRIGGRSAGGGSGCFMFFVESPSLSSSFATIDCNPAAEWWTLPFQFFDGATFGGVRDLEPCTVFVPTGCTCECSQLCLAALFLAVLIQDGDVARVFKASLTDYGLRSDLAIQVTMLLAELDRLASHDEPLKDLVYNHKVSCITHSLRCLIADVVLRTADEEISVADEMYVPEEHALWTYKSGTPVPVAAVARFVQALGLRAALLFDYGGTVHRREVGAADAPFLGGLLVRDGHMSAVICKGHAPAPILAHAPRPISIRFGEDGGAILRLKFSMKPIP